MHPEAYSFVKAAEQMRQCSTGPAVVPIDILEVGGRNVNGTVRDLFTFRRYVCTDLYEGEGVDVVVDFSQPDTVNGWAGLFDLVISTETLEHARYWRTMVGNMAEATAPGGHLIITCAAPGRFHHSAIDGHPLGPDETDYYGNVRPEDLRAVLDELGLDTMALWTRDYPQDLYALARKPR